VHQWVSMEINNYVMIFYDFPITFFFSQALNVAEAYVCIFKILSIILFYDFGALFMIPDQFIITFFNKLW
jgi:hypothetical protein